MKKSSYSEALEKVLRREPRFDEQVYYFIREALDHTIEQLNKPVEGPARHVTGVELLDGIRDFALKEYGPMAYRVLTHWGVRNCADFGDIVFHLVEVGILGKTESDQRDDFHGGYDFKEAFLAPFVAQRTKTNRRKTRNPSRSTTS